MVSQTVAYVVTVVVALIVLIRRTGRIKFLPNRLVTVAVLKQSLPFALLVLLMASYNRLDPVLLQSFSVGGAGNFNAGIYAGAFRMLDALTMIAYLVSVPLLPTFSRLSHAIRQDDTRHDSAVQLKETVRMMTSLMVVFAVSVAMLMSTQSYNVMNFFYQENVEDYATVFKVLIFGLIPISLTYVFGTLLTANGNLKTLNVLALITLVLNVILNIVLIPRYGSVGSAIAGVTAQSFMALSQVVVSLSLFRMRASVTYIIKLVCFTLIIVILSKWLEGFTWWVPFVAVTVVAVLLSVAMKIIDIKEIIIDNKLKYK